MKIKKIFLSFSFIALAANVFCQINLSSGDCKDIQRKEDKFTGQVILSTPPDEIVFVKDINGNVTDYYCRITEDEDNIFTGRGVIIVLKDGTRIKKPEADLKVDISTPRFRHTVFFKLTADDVAKLSKSEITDFKMFSLEFSTNRGPQFNKFLNCLIGKQ